MSQPVNTTNQIAFKEWAVVCSALETGLQSLILRKGGIHEGREGFRVAQGEFWLFPTGFHQEPESVVPAARPILEQVMAQQPPTDIVEICDYVQVEDVVHTTDQGILSRLAPWHIWSETTVTSRFHYKTPGLFVMLVRVYRRETPIQVANSTHFAGCRSWVDLPDPLSTVGLSPVIPDEVHAARMAEIRNVLSRSKD